MRLERRLKRRTGFPIFTAFSLCIAAGSSGRAAERVRLVLASIFCELGSKKVHGGAFRRSSTFNFVELDFKFYVEFSVEKSD